MLTFEWNEEKNRANLKKHGVDFATAELVFDDPNCVTFVERILAGERRWHAIGLVEDIVLLVVVHTYRAQPEGEAIRIISARQGTSRERRLYAKAIGG